MSNLKKEIELLYTLQDYDVKIDICTKQIDEKLISIQKKQTILNNNQLNLNIKKKSFGQLVLNKNIKESELSNIEQMLNKYLTELNNAKSNAMYKTLLAEIEKYKLKKVSLEDDIIKLMYKIDNDNETLMNHKYEYEQHTKQINSEIYKITFAIDKLKRELILLKKTKEEFRKHVKQAFLAQYDRLNSNRIHPGDCVCLVKENSCNGCGIILRPQLINQVEKYKELVFCDNCSCILLKL
jgi:predicted  nucleic acid-binding Zn-ribbon protein